MVTFRKSKKIGPLRFTLSPRGISTSVGVKGARVSLGSDGKVRRTVGVPGTGIYDTKVLGAKRKRRAAREPDLVELARVQVNVYDGQDAVACAVPGCFAAAAPGWPCPGHYEAQRRGLPSLMLSPTALTSGPAPSRYEGQDAVACSVPNCFALAAPGWPCPGHYEAQRQGLI